MGLTISTNVASIAAQRHLAKAEAQTSRAIQALASGSRLVQPGQDAAGFAIAESLRGQAASLKTTKQNADNAIGLIQVAEGGLSEQNNILVRLRELAVQAASDTVGDDERQFINVEFQQLTQEFDRIAKTTRYANKNLLTGTNEEYSFQIGTGNKDEDVIRYRLEADTRIDSLGLSGIGVEDQRDARYVLNDIDQAMLKMANARAGFGAIQSRLEIAGNNVQQQYENIRAAHSRIADADVAYEVAQLTQGQILQDFGTSVLAQANQNPSRAAKLLI